MNSFVGRPCTSRSPACGPPPQVAARAPPAAVPAACPQRDLAAPPPRAALDLSHLARDLAQGLVAAAAVAALAAPPLAPPPALANTANYTIDVRPSAGDEEAEYFQTAPAELSSADEGTKGPRMSSYLEGPRGKEVQDCTRKCMPTCIRGGQGAPGLGPMSVRKEMVVFKEGYRSRTYCLRECVEVCNITVNPPPKPAAPAATQ